MSRLSPNQLTVRELEALKDGVHSDGGNLWITVAGKARTWSFRYTSPTSGKRREMGLGRYRDISLATARQRAVEARNLVRDGVDPIEERIRLEAHRERDRALTFQAVAARYVEERRPGWRDPRSEPVWTSSLERFAYPLLGSKPIAAVTTDDVLAVLRPIWTSRTETADRLRGRVERILDYARTQGWREGDNPARWRGHLAHILPKPSSVVTVQHHAAIPVGQLPAAMAALARSDGSAAKAVRFACLTVARSGEVRGATWREIDLAAKVWIVPAERMKARKEHRVPLSSDALELLRRLAPATPDPGALVFPGGRPGQPLSDVALSKAFHAAAKTKSVTVHGIRSTFRDWVAEATDHPRDAAEMALAHRITDQVEAAYRRGDMLQRRFALMEDWAVTCCPAAPEPSSSEDPRT